MIYFNPKDNPGKYVVRCWKITREGPAATTELSVHERLEGAREAVPAGLVCLTRSPTDDPVIVEVWV